MNKKLYELRNIAYSLSEGIDPTSGLKFHEDTILNHPDILDFNREIKELLDELILFWDSGERKTNKKIGFCLSAEMKSRIILSEEPISISKFCYEINKLTPHGMRKIQATQVTQKLVEMQILKTIKSSDGLVIKIPTEKGMQIGISTEDHISSYGLKYRVNKYNKQAQQYILDNAIPNFV